MKNLPIASSDTVIYGLIDNSRQGNVQNVQNLLENWTFDGATLYDILYESTRYNQSDSKEAQSHLNDHLEIMRLLIEKGA